MWERVELINELFKANLAIPREGEDFTQMIRIIYELKIIKLSILTLPQKLNRSTTNS
jgi:hypothetical protein